MKVGVIGLGTIGGGVAQCLARADMLAAIYDIDPQVAARLDVGLDNSTSPRNVVEQCDVVLIAVFSAEQVEAVLTGENGCLAAARPNVSLVLLSTVSLKDFARLAEIAGRGGYPLIDCGVTGGKGAAQKKLVSLVGGTDEAVARVRPALEAFSNGVFHTGPAGCGMAAKIARNVIVYGTWRVEMEAFELAKAAGVNVPSLIDAIENSREGSAPPSYWYRAEYGMYSIDASRRPYVASVLEKDLDAALELATRVGMRLPATEVARGSGPAIAGLEKYS